MSAPTMPEEAIDQPESAHAAAVRGLLDLPGEIRNRIYDYIAVETTLNVIQHHGWMAPPGMKSLSLARVCGALRNEIYPLFISRTTFSIQLEHIHAFINCFILPPGVDIRNAVGRVVIDIPNREQTIDVRPLLHLSNIAKGISVVFKSADFQEFEVDPEDWDSQSDIERVVRNRTLHDIVKRLLGVNDNAKFSSYVGDAVTAMLLTLSPATRDFGEFGGDITTTWVRLLDVKLTGQHWKPWLLCWGPNGWDRYESEHGFEQAVEDWDTGTGMDLPYDYAGLPTENIMFSRPNFWHERLAGLPWSEAIEEA